MSQPVKLSDSLRPLSECLNSVDSPRGRTRVSKYLRSQPFPHYEPHPKGHSLLIRIEANGERTVGHFVNRRFQTVKAGK